MKAGGYRLFCVRYLGAEAVAGAYRLDEWRAGLVVEQVRVALVRHGVGFYDGSQAQLRGVERGGG